MVGGCLQILFEVLLEEVLVALVVVYIRGLGRNLCVILFLFVDSIFLFQAGVQAVVVERNLGHLVGNYFSTEPLFEQTVGTLLHLFKDCS